MYPDCDEILKLANDYDIIPVCREIYACSSFKRSIMSPSPPMASIFNTLSCVRSLESFARPSRCAILDNPD